VIGFYKDSQQHHEAIWNKLKTAQSSQISHRYLDSMQSSSSYSIASNTAYPEKRFESPRTPPTPPTNSIHSLRLQKVYENINHHPSHMDIYNPVEKVCNIFTFLLLTELAIYFFLFSPKRLLHCPQLLESPVRVFHYSAMV
jgi:hypothetical protein